MGSAALLSTMVFELLVTILSTRLLYFFLIGPVEQIKMVLVLPRI